jgi:hypothetical protein
LLFDVAQFKVALTLTIFDCSDTVENTEKSEYCLIDGVSDNAGEPYTLHIVE